MAHEISVPRLGWSMEEGIFIRWLKRDGDFVRRGEALFELEGEKALQEIESLDDGILRIPPDAPKEGSVVPVGQLLGYLAAEGESISDSALTTTPLPQATTVAPENSANDQKPASGEQVTDEAARTVVQPRPSTVASPRAKRVAREHNLDWTQLAGSGSKGQVRQRDVQAALAQHSSEPNFQAERMILSNRRRVIAQRMVASRQNMIPVTLFSKANADNLVNLREQFKSVSDAAVVPSYQDFITKLVGNALAKHRLLAGRLEEDAIVLPPDHEIHIGMAVDTSDGLLVPVLRNIVGHTIMEIARQSRDAVERARQGKLTRDEMRGGVFTITNLGAFGVDGFTPIINAPEASILGLGAIRREPTVLDDGQICPTHQITLSLTFDHRMIDGAPAARFLQDIVRAINNPSPSIMDVA